MNAQRYIVLQGKNQLKDIIVEKTTSFKTSF